MLDDRRLRLHHDLDRLGTIAAVAALHVYTPSAQGWIRPAKLVSARSNPDLFPDLAQARAPVSIAVPRFSMRFPVSQIISGPV